MGTKPDRWAAAAEARTLFEAHEVLGRLQPAPDAAPPVRRDYHERSAAIYARIAEVDRGHHHEALYWMAREWQKAAEFAVTA